MSALPTTAPIFFSIFSENFDRRAVADFSHIFFPPGLAFYFFLLLKQTRNWNTETFYIRGIIRGTTYVRGRPEASWLTAVTILQRHAAYRQSTYSDVVHRGFDRYVGVHGSEKYPHDALGKITQQRQHTAGIAAAAAAGNSAVVFLVTSSVCFLLVSCCGGVVVAVCCWCWRCGVPDWLTSSGIHTHIHWISATTPLSHLLKKRNACISCTGMGDGAHCTISRGGWAIGYLWTSTGSTYRTRDVASTFWQGHNE